MDALKYDNIKVPETSYNSLIDYVDNRFTDQCITLLEECVFELGYANSSDFEVRNLSYDKKDCYISEYILLDIKNKKQYILIQVDSKDMTVKKIGQETLYTF